ncbi:hypothetical protein QC764_113785 [Podospora pseudoanserina]|uniref:Uncharacterized protein n=1 Tax=Podospora pseudoanserina TaxID=2609844 RepID=A0ABR0IQQ0_9PEZI|nr:hypothetical protein QC764_113785 [Podospora pseudoanserina]
MVACARCHRNQALKYPVEVSLCLSGHHPCDPAQRPNHPAVSNLAAWQVDQEQPIDFSCRYLITPS